MKLEELMIDEEELLTEMANIGPSDHKFNSNIKFNILQPGKWKLSGHGPRIKIFKGKYEEFKNIIILLDKNILNIKFLEKSYNNNKKLVSRSELNDLIIYFKKYRFAYLIMWLDRGMLISELVELLDEIYKDPKSVENKFLEVYNNL